MSFFDLHKVKVFDIYGQGLQCHDQSVNLITDMQCPHQIGGSNIENRRVAKLAIEKTLVEII